MTLIENMDDLDSDSEERMDLDDGGEDSDEEDGHVVSTHTPCFEQGACVEIESSFEDQSEQMKVDQFLAKSCGCKLGPQGAACSSVVLKQAIVQTRNNCLQMTNHELDLVIMAQINAQRTMLLTDCAHIVVKETSGLA